MWCHIHQAGKSGNGVTSAERAPSTGRTWDGLVPPLSCHGTLAVVTHLSTRQLPPAPRPPVQHGLWRRNHSPYRYTALYSLGTSLNFFFPLHRNNSSAYWGKQPKSLTRKKCILVTPSFERKPRTTSSTASAPQPLSCPSPINRYWSLDLSCFDLPGHARDQIQFFHCFFIHQILHPALADNYSSATTNSHSFHCALYPQAPHYLWLLLEYLPSAFPFTTAPVNLVHQQLLPSQMRRRRPTQQLFIRSMWATPHQQSTLQSGEKNKQPLVCELQRRHRMRDVGRTRPHSPFATHYFWFWTAWSLSTPDLPIEPSIDHHCQQLSAW